MSWPEPMPSRHLVHRARCRAVWEFYRALQLTSCLLAESILRQTRANKLSYDNYRASSALVHIVLAHFQRQVLFHVKPPSATSRTAGILCPESLKWWIMGSCGSGSSQIFRSYHVDEGVRVSEPGMSCAALKASSCPQDPTGVLRTGLAPRDAGREIFVVWKQK